MKKKQHDDREMISNPARWPLWPILPLKNANKKDATGLSMLAVLFEDGDNKLKIAIDVNMYDLPDPKIKWIDITVDEVLAQGWIVN